MNTINQLSISTERLLAPTDSDGAIMVRGLHINLIISKINELITEYGITNITPLNNFKVAEYNYRGNIGGSQLHIEDVKPIINVVNDLISRDNLDIIPLSVGEIARRTDYKTPDDIFIVRGLHLALLTRKLNVVIVELGESIPFPNEALLWLDGTTSGNEFVDRTGNDRNFTITDKDWTDNEYLPYKSAAKISAPAGDATLIAADVNNFLYDSGGTPNQIPVVSFFQNIDYENQIFCRHVAQVLNDGNQEIVEPNVIDIVAYSSALSGTELSIANTYYEVPENVSDLIVAPVGGDYDEITAAVEAAIAGQNIYVKTGIYTEPTYGYLRVEKEVTIVGIGRVELKVPGAQGIYAASVVAPTIKNIYINGNATNLYCIYNIVGNSLTAERIYTSGNINRNIFHRGTELTITNCVLVEAGSAYSTIEARDAITLTGCFFGGAVNSGEHIIDTNTGTFAPIIKYCKFATTLSTTSYLFSFGATLTGLTVEHNEFICNEMLSIQNLWASSKTGTFNWNYNNITYTSSTARDILRFNSGTYDVICKYNNINATTCSAAISQEVSGDIGDMLIEGNKIIVTGNAHYGIYTQRPDSLIIRNNLIHIEESTDGYGMYLGDATLDQTFSCLVEKNAVYGPQYYGTFEDQGRMHAGIFNWRIDGCETRFNFVTGALLGIVYKADGSFSSTANSIHHNVLIENRITIKGIDDVEVYNNTVEVDGAIDILNTDVTKFAQNNIFKNNILLEKEDITAVLSIVEIDHVECEVGTVFDYNIFHSVSGLYVGSDVTNGDMNFAQWQAAGYDVNGDELTSSEYNNLFNTGKYSLKSGSSAIGVGENLGASFENGLSASTNWGTDTSLPVVITEKQKALWDVGAYIS